jgi:hypothetical protein
MEKNLIKRILENGGIIKPLLISSEKTKGTGLCNPSLCFVNGKMIVNIRHVGYNLYHSEEGQKYPSWHGPLIYLHPEDDLKLRTENYLFEVDPLTLEIVSEPTQINMFFNKKPLWEFIGLEDVRLVNWDKKLYATGVRRDTTTNGEGRMELSEIHLKTFTEFSRKRIDPPNNSYCEKNWMPIKDMPFHYVKWTNPTEVVSVTKEKTERCKSESLFTKSSKIVFPRDIRGGSQVIPYKNGYIALTHEVDLWNHSNGMKDAQYYHRFVIWNKDFEVVKASKEFKFINGRIEFSCGLEEDENNYYVTFGFQDNAAYITKFSKTFLDNFINE